MMAEPREQGKSLAGRMAVVTGGSSGIGAACARLLAAEGARVVVGYNHGEERAQQVVASLAGQGHGVARLPLAEPRALEPVAERLRETLGRVDVLVNSAGYTRRIAHKNVEILSPELFN